MTWQTLGATAPDQLAHTREQLHCVAQVIANVPRLLVPAAPDWGHSAFHWDEALQALVSVEVPAGTPFRVALRVANATALVLDQASTEVASLATDGLTIEQLFDWLTRHATSQGATLPKPLDQASDTLPHPCVAGQTFDLANRPALDELARYYDNSNRALQAISEANEHTTPVRTWPHHMDMALLIELDPNPEPGADPETARSVSFGMQPGDGFSAEPYFYSSPWPYPSSPQWPALAADGAWNTEGFTAAILSASALIAAGDAAAQQQALTAFTVSAIEGNRALLED